jgi:hypothetical protein
VWTINKHTIVDGWIEKEKKKERMDGWMDGYERGAIFIYVFFK